MGGWTTNRGLKKKKKGARINMERNRMQRDFVILKQQLGA